MNDLIEPIDGSDEETVACLSISADKQTKVIYITRGQQVPQRGTDALCFQGCRDLTSTWHPSRTYIRPFP